MAFHFERVRSRWGFEDYLDRLRRDHPAYEYGFDAGRDYLKVWKQPKTGGQLSRSVVAFVDPQGNVYRADSWKKRGRLMGHVEKMGTGYIALPAEERKASHDVRRMQWHVVRKGYGPPRVLGTYDTRAAAERHARQLDREALQEFKEGRIMYDMPEHVVERGHSGRERDPRRRRHRSAGAPTFAQQRAIHRKMRILERENVRRRPPRSQAQMLAIAYRYAGVPPRPARRRRRLRS